jgi:hypothetical protein
MNAGAMAAKYQLHDSLDEMLSVGAMSCIEGRTVTTIRPRAWLPGDFSVSGAEFRGVETVDDTGASRQYVVKRTGHERDLIMRNTEDFACREMLVWQQGLLDRLPVGVTHAILGAARDGDGWALLMRDLGRSVFSPHVSWPAHGWQSLAPEDSDRLLDAVAAFHAEYWEDTTLLDPAHGLCPLPALYASFSPATTDREIERAGGYSGEHITARHVGWLLLESSMPADIALVVRALQTDLAPLCATLERYPWTFVHGDIKRQNVGVERGAAHRIVLLDWQFATCGPPAIDLTWLLSQFGPVLPISLDEAVEQYRACLAARLGDRFDERWWRPQLELAMLGQFLRHGHYWIYGMTHNESATARTYYRDLISWWTGHLRAGAALL